MESWLFPFWLPSKKARLTSDLPRVNPPFFGGWRFLEEKQLWHLPPMPLPPFFWGDYYHHASPNEALICIGGRVTLRFPRKCWFWRLRSQLRDTESDPPFAPRQNRWSRRISAAGRLGPKAGPVMWHWQWEVVTVEGGADIHFFFQIFDFSRFISNFRFCFRRLAHVGALCYDKWIQADHVHEFMMIV